MEKKKLLFVIESLNIGGAEKSLVTLLNLLDYSQYDVDLLLFAQGGPFQSLLPATVNLLPAPTYFEYLSVPWTRIFEKIRHPKQLGSQLSYSAGIRVNKLNNTEKAVLFWKACKDCLPSLQTHYDVAIAYAQGLPTFYVADKVNAKKKAAWINVTYLPTGDALKFIKPYYNRFDVVNAVSESVQEQMMDTFGIPVSKTMVMRDILDDNFARRMSRLDSTVFADMDYQGVKFLTVGRLAHMKGYGLAVEAANILRERGVCFRWYAIGDGPLRAELQDKISSYQLEDFFVLLGSRSNPYPYFANCDIYVQPSRFEGFGITLAEAKMFQKPIVTTNFDAVGAQFVNEKNGLIVDISAQAIADGIVRMLSDNELREACAANLAAEKIGNAEEIKKLYSIVLS